MQFLALITSNYKCSKLTKISFEMLSQFLLHLGSLIILNSTFLILSFSPGPLRKQTREFKHSACEPVSSCLYFFVSVFMVFYRLLHNIYVSV